MIGDKSFTSIIPVRPRRLFKADATDFRYGREAVKRKLELTHALWRAGVTLRLGADVQQPFAVPGVCLHREMSAFEQAGIPRAGVWKLASQDAARALGISDSGSIQAGMRPDVLTSPAPPFDAGWTSKQISAVVAGGNLMHARDIDSSIDRELGRFKSTFSGFTSRWLAQFAMTRLAKRYVP